MPTLNETFPAPFEAYEAPLQSAFSSYASAPVEVTINAERAFIQLKWSAAIAEAASYVGPAPPMPRKYISTLEIDGVVHTIILATDDSARFDFPTLSPDYIV